MPSSVPSSLPKVDLHRHAETYAHLDRLIARHSCRLPYNWKNSLKCLADRPPGMPRLQHLNGDLDINELDAFTMNDVYLAASLKSMMEEAARDGAVLIEVRFGAGAGLRPRLMSLFRKAVQQVRKSYPNFHAQPIAALRFPVPDAAEAFETCLLAHDEGLAGIDLIPHPYHAEADWTIAYTWAERAREAGLGVTAHAGEFSTANLASALRLPGIGRIGHGVYAPATDELLRQVLDCGVTLECCLTSNAVLGAVPSLDEHPIRTLVQAGVAVTLGTDDPVRLCTSIGREYEQAAAMGFGTDDLLSFTRQGILSSFISEDRKLALLDYVETAGSREE